MPKSKRTIRRPKSVEHPPSRSKKYARKAWTKNTKYELNETVKYGGYNKRPAYMKRTKSKRHIIGG